MPPALIHCRTCRTLLNPELEHDSVEIPEFVPLQELDAHVELELRGYYISCPTCSRELRINARYQGKKVTCKQCEGKFKFDFTNPAIQRIGVYVYCPHCNERLRLADKYVGVNVTCKNCSGRLKVNELSAEAR